MPFKNKAHHDAMTKLLLAHIKQRHEDWIRLLEPGTFDATPLGYPSQKQFARAMEIGKASYLKHSPFTKLLPKKSSTPKKNRA